MGVYVKTIRKRPVQAYDMDEGGIVDIAFYKYAYRISPYMEQHILSGEPSGDYGRRRGQTLAAGERARDALREQGVQLATDGDPKDHFRDCEEPMPVMEWKGCAAFADTELPNACVGYLYKKGRQLHFERIK